MTKLPSLTATDVLRAPGRAGFVVVRVSGSHHRLTHPDDPTRQTTVPVHKGRDLPKPVLRAILKQVGLTVEEFVDLL